MRINIVGLALLLMVGTAQAQIVRDSIEVLQRIDIEEHLGEQVPLDLQFVNDAGDSVTLRDYFDDDQPIILILGYYQCPMLCNLVFNGLVDGIDKLAWTPGQEFQMITVSINPNESHELALAKKTSYLESFKSPVDESGWDFLVGAQDQSEALAEAVGFKFFYDEERQEYAHPAAAFVLTKDGIISRYLYGIEYSKTDLKLSLMEASEGKVGSTIDRLILYCFHYDPDARGYVVVASKVMKLGGGVALLALSIFMGMLWYGERWRKRKILSADPARASTEV